MEISAESSAIKSPFATWPAVGGCSDPHPHMQQEKQGEDGFYVAGAYALEGMSLLEAQGWAAAAWSCIATQDNKRSQQDCWNKLGPSWLHHCRFLTEPPVVMNRMNPTIFVGNPHIFSSVKLEDFFGIPPVFLSTTFDLFLIKPWTCYRENAGSIYSLYV